MPFKEKYVKKMWEDFPYKEEIKDGVSTLAADHLFKVNNKATKLDEEKADVFHTTLARIIFV